MGAKLTSMVGECYGMGERQFHAPAMGCHLAVPMDARGPRCHRFSPRHGLSNRYGLSGRSRSSQFLGRVNWRRSRDAELRHRQHELIGSVAAIQPITFIKYESAGLPLDHGTVLVSSGKQLTELTDVCG